MNYMNRIGACLLVALMMAGCGGDDGASGPVSPDDLADAVTSASCDRLVRCGAFTSRAACEAQLAPDFAQILQGIAAGRISYDGSKVATCLAAFENASCDTTVEDVRVTPAICDEALHGTVGGGGTCYIDLDCASDNCDVPSCGMACCAGACAAAVADAPIGQPCANANCVEGSFCSETEVCTALLAAGATCGSDQECNYGLTCAANRCVAAANRGEACVDDSCQDLGDRCDGTNCVARSGLNGPCSEGFAGFFDCQSPLTCDQATLMCKEPPAVGAMCQFSCAGNAFCNDQNACEAPRAVGATCDDDGQCDSRYCSDAATPVCAARPICG